MSYLLAIETSTKNCSVAVFQNQNILITGANSGIGLELVKKFIDLKNNIFAIFHESSSNLDKIKSDNLFESFFIFCNIFLKKSKDDKYNEGTLNILKYILANKDIISLKLIQN